MKDQIKEALQTYNKYAQMYAEFLETKLLQGQLYEFETMLTKGAKILDIGCGAGRDVEYFNEDGFDAMGIDISKELLKQAEKKKIPVKKMDLLKMDFKKESFDAIWCMATFSDIPKKDALKALKGFNNILKEKGIMYLATKEGEGEQIIKKQRYNNAPRFYALYSKQKLEKYLTDTGFDIIKSTSITDNKNKWIEIFAKKR